MVVTVIDQTFGCRGLSASSEANQRRPRDCKRHIQLSCDVAFLLSSSDHGTRRLSFRESTPPSRPGIAVVLSGTLVQNGSALQFLRSASGLVWPALGLPGPAGQLVDPACGLVGSAPGLSGRACGLLRPARRLVGPAQDRRAGRRLAFQKYSALSRRQCPDWLSGCPGSAGGFLQ